MRHNYIKADLSGDHWAVGKNNQIVLAQIQSFGEQVRVSMTPEQARAFAENLLETASMCEGEDSNQLKLAYLQNNKFSNNWLPYEGNKNPVGRDVLIDIKLFNGDLMERIESSQVAWTIQHAVNKGRRIEMYRIHHEQPKESLAA